MPTMEVPQKKKGLTSSAAAATCADADAAECSPCSCSPSAGRDSTESDLLLLPPPLLLPAEGFLAGGPVDAGLSPPRGPLPAAAISVRARGCTCTIDKIQIVARQHFNRYNAGDQVAD